MKLEAIYDKGRLEFIHPIHFVRDRLRVVVEVPDQEVEAPQDKAPAASMGRYAQALQARLDAIRNAPLPPDDELPEFTEKQRGRIEAFALREDRGRNKEQS
jgi:hypothetical protein